MGNFAQAASRNWPVSSIDLWIAWPHVFDRVPAPPPGVERDVALSVDPQHGTHMDMYGKNEKFNETQNGQSQ